MIESPETAAYVPVEIIEPTEPPAYTPTPKPSDSNDDTEAGVDSAEDVLLVRNKPITSSLRNTILHLRARAGYWSRFRGLSLFVVMNAVGGVIVSVLHKILPHRVGLAIAAIIVDIILARWHMTWVHIVISEPSEKRWYQRVPPLKTWTKIAPAVALWAATTQVVSVMPMLVCGSFGSLKHLRDPDFDPGRKDLYAVGAQAFMGVLIMLALFVLLQIPATVTMVRVAASMLPEEDETIVPFDRTFGGQTTPAIVGGQGKIGLVEAWRSFPWASRVRLLKLVAKVTAIILAVWVLFISVMVAEAHIMLGDKLSDVMKAIHGVAGPH